MAAVKDGSRGGDLFFAAVSGMSGFPACFFSAVLDFFVFYRQGGGQRGIFIITVHLGP